MRASLPGPAPVSYTHLDVYKRQVPVQAIQALPYVMTVVLLAGFIGRAYAPKALGLPYVKER